MAEPTDGDREIAVVIADKYSGARLYAAIAEAIAVARAEGRREERERIAERLAEEAGNCPDTEDAAVYRSASMLVRADFSYDEAEKLGIVADAPDLAAAIAAVREEADAYNDPEYPWSNEMLAHIAALRLGQRMLEALADRDRLAEILAAEYLTIAETVIAAPEATQAMLESANRVLAALLARAGGGE